MRWSEVYIPESWAEDPLPVELDDTLAAGCFVMAKSTNRVLLALRSGQVMSPNTWSIWGGGMHDNENPEVAAEREFREESGYSGAVVLSRLTTYHQPGLIYYNFLAVVPEEFTPTLNWEHSRYVWCDFGAWPSPLHYGIKFLLSDQSTLRNIADVINKRNNK